MEYALNGNYSGPPYATRSGSSAMLLGGAGAFAWYYFGTVRSDVADLLVRLTNGQVLTVRPIQVYAARYERFFAFAVPFSSAVTEVATYSRAGAELQHTVPMALYGGYRIRWFRAGQRALPLPASYLIGSGKVAGGWWRARTYVGPSGTCQVVFYPQESGYPLAQCPSSSLPPGRAAQVLPIRFFVGEQAAEEQGQVTPVIQVAQTAQAVAYLILTRANGTMFRVPTVIVGQTRYCAYSTALSLMHPHEKGGETVVGWTAYASSDRELGAGSAFQ